MHIIVILISYNIIQHYLIDYKKILTMNDDYNIIIKKQILISKSFMHNF